MKGTTKMKSKLFVLLFATAMLTACGGEPSTDPTPSGGDPGTPQTAEYLDWVADNKIVIDLFSIGEAHFSYGNAALNKDSNTLDLNASAALSCSTQLAEDQLVNLVYVTETAAGTGFNAGAALYSAIEGNKLSGFFNDNEDLKGKTRAYVAISFGETVSWTKGKNAAMDAKIQSLVEAAKK